MNLLRHGNEGERERKMKWEYEVQEEIQKQRREESRREAERPENGQSDRKRLEPSNRENRQMKGEVSSCLGHGPGPFCQPEDPFSLSAFFVFFICKFTNKLKGGKIVTCNARDCTLVGVRKKVSLSEQKVWIVKEHVDFMQLRGAALGTSDLMGGPHKPWYSIAQPHKAAKMMSRPR